MPGRIVLFGATGYTGRLTAEALLARGVRPVLAARSAEKLESLAAELDPWLEVAVADSARPESISALLERGDVLITTVGPFTRFGEPALQAALAARATYIDSTGEPAFVRRVFERFGPAAKRAGCGLLTAFGYDYVPGNLAGALALREADRPAALVDIGYFVTGRTTLGAWSGGTLGSLAGALAEPGFAFRDGRLVAEPNGRHVQSFDLRGRDASAISVGGSEHFTLPRREPALREVGVHLGWAGQLSRVLQALSTPTSVFARAPITGPAVRALTARVPGDRAEAQTPHPALAPARTSSRSPATPPDAGYPRSASTARTSTPSPQRSWPGEPSAPPSGGSSTPEHSVPSTASGSRRSSRAVARPVSRGSEARGCERPRPVADPTQSTPARRSRRSSPTRVVPGTDAERRASHLRRGGGRERCGGSVARHAGTSWPADLRASELLVVAVYEGALGDR